MANAVDASLISVQKNKSLLYQNKHLAQPHLLIVLDVDRTMVPDSTLRTSTSSWPELDRLWLTFFSTLLSNTKALPVKFALVTNASTNRITQFAFRGLPQTADFILHHHFDFYYVSAMDRFSHVANTRLPLMTREDKLTYVKEMVFRELLLAPIQHSCSWANLDPQCQNCVLCQWHWTVSSWNHVCNLGDGMYEVLGMTNALRSLQDILFRPSLETFKLISHGGVETLLLQLECIFQVIQSQDYTVRRPKDRRDIVHLLTSRPTMNTWIGFSDLFAPWLCENLLWMDSVLDRKEQEQVKYQIRIRSECMCPCKYWLLNWWCPNDPTPLAILFSYHNCLGDSYGCW